MPHLRGRVVAMASVLTVGLAIAVAGPASASSDHRVVKIRDDCDPATFNAAIGPGTCVGEGETTFGEFLAQFAANKGSVEDWSFRPERKKADAGATVTAVNEGGEAHTFTEVKRFGGGCVDLLNQFEPMPATPIGPSLCDQFFAGAEPSLVTPGRSFQTSALSPGTHLFQCLIHPWMRSTVIVRDRGREDRDDD